MPDKIIVDGIEYQLLAIPKEKQKDYEILSMHGLKQSQWSCDKTMFERYLKNGWTIAQVKRLSDNEVFTIGDKVLDINEFIIDSLNTIDRFEIANEVNIYVYFTSNSRLLNRFLWQIKKQKQPLLTTEDNIPIYEGGRSTKIFSMNDIFEVIKTIDRGSNGSEIRNFLNDKFLELAKNKSNG